MRDNINVDTSLKLFESYRNFTGGLNTEYSNETLKDNETTILQNVDMASRGSMRKREGYKRVENNASAYASVSTTGVVGTGQGVFKYNIGSAGSDGYIFIIAHAGKLYAGVSSYDSLSVPSLPSQMADISADNGGWTFQASYPIDAIQYNNKMYITTGTRIGVLEYDATKTSKFRVADLVASPINEYQATYTGYNLYNSSNDITNIFFNKESSLTGQFNIRVVSKGVIDTSVNTVPDYQFYNEATAATAPVSGVDVLGHTKLILSVTASKLSSGASSIFTVRFEQSADNITWTTPVQDDNGNTTATAQGTHVFTIGAVGGITQQYFRANITAYTVGHITVRTQPQFLLRPPVVGDTVRFWALWDANVGTYATPYDYEFEIKKFDDEAYPTVIAQVYSTKNYFDHVFDGYGQFDIRAKMKKSTSKTSNPAILSPITVYPSLQDVGIQVGSLANEIKKCTRCLIHWNRLILYSGSTVQNPAIPNRIYVSELEDFGYFPMSGYIDLITDAQQPITSIVRHRNQLVLFTPTQIYAMTGKSPSDYNLALINDQIGCTAGSTVSIVDNDIYFANPQGVHALRPNAYILDTFNVAMLSDKVSSFYESNLSQHGRYGESVYSFYYADHYYMANRDASYAYSPRPVLTMMKYHVPTRTWSTETIDGRGSTAIYNAYTGVQGAVVVNKHLYILYTSAGQPLDVGAAPYYYISNLSVHFEGIDVYSDLYTKPYTMKVRTKFFDFNASFNRKKLKRLYLLVSTNDDAAENIRLAVTVEADSQAILDPNVGSVSIVGGVATWIVTPTFNFDFDLGTLLGDWVLAVDALGAYPIACEYLNIRGKCRRIRLTVEHSDPSPAEVIAAGFQFRLKQP